MPNSAHHDFLNPRCRPAHVRTYGVRRAILRELKAALPLFNGTFLHVGSGYAPYKPLLTNAPSRIEKYIGLVFRENLMITGLCGTARKAGV